MPSLRCMSQNGLTSGGRSRPLPCRPPKPPPRPTPSADMPTVVDARTFSSLATPTTAEPQAVIADGAAALGPDDLRRADQDLASKFGPLTVIFFSASNGTPRQCLAYVRAFDDPRLQLSGWFCQGGSEFIQQSTLACALDRLTLLAAGSEPKVGALFAHAERNRTFCGQRDPILAATPKYHLLWKALASRPKPRRIGR